MKLFNCEDGYNVEINFEVFLIKEFKDLYTSRKANDELVQKELAYIYFNNDLTSDFQFQRDSEERSEEIKLYVNLNSKWEPDEYIKSCEKAYINLSRSVTGDLLESTYDLINKVRSYMDNINLDEKDKQGKPVHNLKQVLESINKVPELIKAMDKAEKEYVKQQKENNQVAGKKTKGIYEQ